MTQTIDNLLDPLLRAHARVIYNSQLSRLERPTNSQEDQLEKLFALCWLYDGACKPLGYNGICEMLDIRGKEREELRSKYPRPKKWPVPW